jgi:hypothetical protein
VELISRMMDGSIPYDPEGRLEPVSSGPGAKQEDRFSSGCGAAGASSAACYLADDATAWSGGVYILTAMTMEHDEPSCLIAAE